MRTRARARSSSTQNIAVFFFFLAHACPPDTWMHRNCVNTRDENEKHTHHTLQVVGCVAGRGGSRSCSWAGARVLRAQHFLAEGGGGVAHAFREPKTVQENVGRRLGVGWWRVHMSKSKLSAVLNLHFFFVRTCHLQGTQGGGNRREAQARHFGNRKGTSRARQGGWGVAASMLTSRKASCPLY